MKSIAALSGTHLRTYDAIFRHPAAHNLAWHDVHALFRQLGTVEEESNGNFKVTRNGQVLVLHPARTKDVTETGELMTLRHFLERSTVNPAVASLVGEAEWLVVIDHHEARIYRTAAPGSVPQLIRPHVADDLFRHAPHSKEFARGQEKPDPNSFFEPVAALLNGAGKILVFGSGTGTGSEMEQFITWLKLHRPEVARRIVGTAIVDEKHQTEGQLLAHARELYANLAPVTP
jgi:hypothetical protein